MYWNVRGTFRWKKDQELFSIIHLSGMFLAVYVLRCWDSEPLVIWIMGRSLPVVVLCSDRIIQCRAQHSLARSYPQLVAYRKVDALLGFFQLVFYGSVLFNMRVLTTPVLGTLSGCGCPAS